MSESPWLGMERDPSELSQPEDYQTILAQVVREDIGEWASAKGLFSWQGLTRQRRDDLVFDLPL